MYPNRKRKTKLPLCSSPFLQDVIIALGRRSLKSLRYSNSTLTFEVVNEDLVDGMTERLNIEAHSYSNRLTKLSIWDDRIAWVFARQREGKAAETRRFETHANLAAMNAEEVAELIRDTLRDPFSMKSVWTNRNERRPAVGGVNRARFSKAL